MAKELMYQKLRRSFRRDIKSQGLTSDRESVILYLADVYMSALKKVMEDD